MQFGFFTVHPAALPLGNELGFLISSTINQGVLMYSAIIKPEIMELKEILALL